MIKYVKQEAPVRERSRIFGIRKVIISLVEFLLKQMLQAVTPASAYYKVPCYFH